MQNEGSPTYLRHHTAEVKGVAFSPRDRHLFCSGGHDGRVNLYSAAPSSAFELLISYQLTSTGTTKHINGVRFTSDGRRILAATTARRLAVLDVERGEQILCYDNCAFNGQNRVPVAADPICPHLAVCTCVNGKGLTLFDLRMPLPFDFVLDLHSSIIRDIAFLHNSWPFIKSHQSGLVTLSQDGVCKVTTLDGKGLHCFEVGHNANSITPTPEAYRKEKNDFNSVMMIGGDYLSGYRPDLGLLGRQDLEDKNSQIWKLKYTSNGSLLYAACESGKVKRYRRLPDGVHRHLGDVLSHRSPVLDIDISPNDEYIVSASKDKTVGVMKLGAPNHGPSGYCELT